MKHIQIYITALLSLCFLMLWQAPLAFADEIYQQLSLGAGNLGMAPSDAKSPEPGVVTAKYGFKIAKDFMPYMATGLAYTYQSDTKTGDITKLKTGVAAQFGFNYLLGTNTTLKLDYKYLSVSPELPRGDSRTPPQSLGIGFDIKF
jgi:outer membrane protein W